MGNAQKALVMAAGIFLAIALITIAVVMFISAQDATKTAQKSFSSIQNDLASTAYTVYDNTTVSGSQVINAIRKYQTTADFGIKVVTGSDSAVTSGAGYWYGHTLDMSSTSPTTYGMVNSSATGNMTNATTPGNPEYINPSGSFTANLVKDNSNVIHGIIFIQQTTSTSTSTTTTSSP